MRNDNLVPPKTKCMGYTREVMHRLCNGYGPGLTEVWIKRAIKREPVYIKPNYTVRRSPPDLHSALPSS